MTIRIRSTFSSIIQQNTNALFDLLFGPNRTLGTALLLTSVTVPDANHTTAEANIQQLLSAVHHVTSGITTVYPRTASKFFICLWTLQF